MGRDRLWYQQSTRADYFNTNRDELVREMWSGLEDSSVVDLRHGGDKVPVSVIVEN